MEEISLAHGLLKYLHILLFVYWLGGDAGVAAQVAAVVQGDLGGQGFDGFQPPLGHQAEQRHRRVGEDDGPGQAEHLAPGQTRGFGQGVTSRPS